MPGKKFKVQEIGGSLMIVLPRARELRKVAIRAINDRGGRPPTPGKSGR